MTGPRTKVAYGHDRRPAALLPRASLRPDIFQRSAASLQDWATPVSALRITAGPFVFSARLEDAAPRTCAKFTSLLPYRERIIHVRWSGEACWIPLGALDLGLPFENHTSYPAPGDVLLYPGGISETRARSGNWPAIIS